MTNGEPEPISWQELYEQLHASGLSKCRATQAADWVIRRGVEGTRRTALYSPALEADIAILIEYGYTLLKDGHSVRGFSALPPGWRDMTLEVVQFLEAAMAGNVDANRARWILGQAEAARQWRLENAGRDDESETRARLVRVIIRLV
jgi:hypothetical protein